MAAGKLLEDAAYIQVAQNAANNSNHLQTHYVSTGGRRIFSSCSHANHIDTFPRCE